MKMRRGEVAVWMRCARDTFSIQASGVDWEPIDMVVERRSRGGTDLWVYVVDLDNPVVVPGWAKELGVGSDQREHAGWRLRWYCTECEDIVNMPLECGCIGRLAGTCEIPDQWVPVRLEIYSNPDVDTPASRKATTHRGFFGKERQGGLQE